METLTNRETDLAERPNEERLPISSDRYVLGKKIGQGAWGKVYHAEDRLTGQNDLAIKVLAPTPLAQKQMEYRNLDAMRAIANESRRLTACSHIVPGAIDIDDDGIPFVVMPFYKHFLSDVLNDNGHRKYLNHGLDRKQVNGYLLGIAKGTTEVHEEMKRAHCDIKADNIALHNGDGRPLINDFGASTCASLTGASVSPRDNMGDLQARAPECFKENSHPDKYSDSYSFFSIGYRLLTGEHPFERELNENLDFFNQITPDHYEKILKHKLKRVPRDYRKLFESCGKLNGWGRASSRSILTDLEQVIENQNSWKVLKDRAKKVILPSAIPSALLAAAIYFGSSYEPKDLKIPDFNNISAIPSLEETASSNIKFDKENPNLLNLPAPGLTGMMDAGFEKNIARYVSENRVVCALASAYNSALTTRGALGRPSGENKNGYYSDEQLKIFQKWRASNPQQQSPYGPYRGEIHHQVVAKSIEYSLTQAVRPDGKVDLEDTLSIALEGTQKIDQARRAAKLL